MLKQLRYFFTLMLLAVASVGFAEEWEWDLSKKSYSSASEDLVTWTSDYVTMQAEKANAQTPANNYLGGDANNRTSSRFYKGSTLTITPEDGYTISSVVFTATSNSYASALQSSTWTNATAALDGTTVTVTPTDGTEAIVATIGGTNGHTKVIVTYAANGTSTLKPAGLSFETTSFTVEPRATFTAPKLLNPNNLTGITYTSNNEDVAEVDEETGEVTIGEDEGTATITASFAGNDEYKSGSASYTITVKAPVQALENIAALSAQETNGEYDVNLSNAVVTYVNGNYAYIQDASGAIVMYKSGHGLTAGQVLNGTATVTFQLRNSNPQITALSGIEATDGTAPEPTEVAADAWNTPIATVLSQYFKVTGATLTKDGNRYYVQLGDENVQLYGQAGANPVSVASLEPTYTIIGFPTLYNTTKELQIFVQPIPEEEVVVVPTPTFNPAAGAVEAGTTVTIELPEGAEGIEYSFDQQTWNEYTAPIEITEATTIYARAYDQDDNYSEVVSAKYTIKEEVPTQDVVIVEEDKTTFLFNTPGNEWGFPTKSKDIEEAEFTANGKTIKIAGTEGNGYRYYGTYLLFGKQGAYLTLPAFDFAVGKIEVVGNSGASGDVKQNIFVDDNAVSTETKGAKETNTYIIPTLYQEAGTVYTLKVTSAHNSQVTQIIVYKADGTTELADPELAFDVDAVAAILGEEFTAPELTFAPGFEGTITYTSSNPDVAEVDNEGNVTLKSAGETTITASSEANDYFFADEASYVLTVSEAVDPTNDFYQLVTDASTLAAGDEIILAYVDAEYNAVALSKNQGNNNRPAVAVTFNTDGSISPSIDTQIITLETTTTDTGDKFLFNVGNGYLYAASSGSNWLRTETEADDNAKATIEISGGDATIVFQGANTRNNLRFNANGNNPLFSCYAESSTVKTLPRIYRKVAEVEIETVSVTISSAEWATLYYSDKAFKVPEGVTANIVTAVNDKEIVFEPLEEGIIPAGAAVALNGPQGTYDFEVVYVNLAAPANNLLRGFDASHLTEGGDIYYKLTVKNDVVGFYWGEENGEAFESGAHKAYLAIPAEASNAKFFVLGTAGDLVSEDGGFVDGINEVTASDSKKEYFNLNGTRVNSLRKGIYIVGGKKVVIK